MSHPYGQTAVKKRSKPGSKQRSLQRSKIVVKKRSKQRSKQRPKQRSLQRSKIVVKKRSKQRPKQRPKQRSLQRSKIVVKTAVKTAAIAAVKRRSNSTPPSAEGWEAARPLRASTPAVQGSSQARRDCYLLLYIYIISHIHMLLIHMLLIHLYIYIYI